MKLRMKDGSLRLRLAPSEVGRLLKEGRVAETVYFAQGDVAKLTYALQTAENTAPVSVRVGEQELAVVVPAGSARYWAESTEVGLYGQVPVANGVLEIAIEKDFACLDKSEAENTDTYPNPKEGTVC